MDEDKENKLISFFRDWCIQVRAAKIQKKKALQEEIRALGMEISAFEKLIKEFDTKEIL